MLSVRVITFCAFAFVALGCASPRLTLLTSPDKASVYAKPIGAGQRKLLGVTPLTIDHGKIETQYAGSGPVYVEFIKDGYLPYRVYITELSMIQTELRADLSPQTGLEDQEGLNYIVESMFESQRLTKVKRYDEALKILSDVQAKAPYISGVYEMKAGIYFLRGAYRDAYDSYARAVLLNPKNADAQRMKNYLQTSYGYISTDDPMDVQAHRLPTADPKAAAKKAAKPVEEAPAAVVEEGQPQPASEVSP